MPKDWKKSDNEDMKKGDKNRGEILLQKLIRGKEFQRGIESLRVTFGIPPNGYSEMPEIGQWYSKRMDITKETTPAMEAFGKAVDEFLVTQALPIGTWWQHKIIEYILANGEIDFLWTPPGVEPFVEVINKPNPTKEGSYSDLRIYEGATQRDLKGFLSRFWRIVRPSYRKGTHKQIRKEKDALANDEAVKVYDLPRKDRRQMAGTNSFMATTKEVEIGRILKNRGIRKSGDAAKAIKYRRMKAKR